ncbi:hypothetical protein FKG96_01810 [Olivibacter sp. LS-1]|jgi:sensor histidine kinase YesM|uniref:sensor histidine kinase n=1 Tax=unclassified Olivibacter TaxID=2632301 RepID=UPI0011EB93E6|nr:MULTISPECIES: histidine kinase [unclassified Olivibacter]MDM8177897.1 histidine kinase [Olivibacter sp. 47]QEK99583.1 hypothetical protein FKG96_01810 [Olivibacter sp. LS-1]
MIFATDFLRKRKVVLWHIVGWFILIAYEVSFVIAFGAKVTPFVVVFAYILAIALFYFHAHWALTRKNRQWLLLLIPLEVLIYYETIMFLDYLKLFDYENRPSFSEKSLIIKHSYRALFFIMLSTVYWIFINALQKHRQVAKLEQERAENEQKQAELKMKLIKSQNAKLRTQIEPHFIFNTMNFIYDAVEGVSEKAGEAVLLLSEIMRYTLQKTDDDHEVPLQMELENIRNLIRINHIRTNGKLNITLEINLVDYDLNELKILPLLFTTFVENMYKHGDLTDHQAPGIVYVIAEHGELVFKTWNKKRTHMPVQGTFVGISNARERLQSFYNDRFSLSIENRVHDFLIELKIRYAHDTLLCS